MFPGIVFEPTITFGLLFQTLAMGATFVWFLAGLRNEIALIKSEISHVEKAQETLAETIDNLSKILTQVAVQDTRINQIERSIDEMRHGKGYVN